MNSKEIITYLAVKYNGDWDQIYEYILSHRSEDGTITREDLDEEIVDANQIIKESLEKAKKRGNTAVATLVKQWSDDPISRYAGNGYYYHAVYTFSVDGKEYEYRFLRKDDILRIFHYIINAFHIATHLL